MNTAIVWLRRDLRLHDQPAFRCAAAHERLLPLYVHDPDGYAAHAGEASRWWLHHSLAALAGRLAEAGSRLHLDVGDSGTVLAGWAQAVGAVAIYTTYRADPGDEAEIARVRQHLADQGLSLHAEADGLLTNPWTVRNRGGRPYRAFTPFWRNAAADLSPPTPQECPTLPPAPESPPQSLSLPALGLLSPIPWHTKLHGTWQPGETEALHRLAGFLSEGIGCYATQRDLPAVAGTSRLSPSLHFGELSIRDLWHRLSRASAAQPEDEDGIAAFRSELGWREFAYHLLAQEPELHSRPFDRRFEAFPWRDDPHGALLQAWREGKTGIPLVDAGMRELWATGWMHNRTRMVTGSFLVKNLRLPWQWGEAFFRDTLVDWDPASNSMGWQWVTGCGADAAPYFRVFNPVRQAERFDPDGVYIARWVPELANLPPKHRHQPWSASAQALAQAGVTLGVTYPRPIIDLQQSRKEALAAFQTLG